MLVGLFSLTDFNCLFLLCIFRVLITIWRVDFLFWPHLFDVLCVFFYFYRHLLLYVRKIFFYGFLIYLVFELCWFLLLYLVQKQINKTSPNLDCSFQFICTLFITFLFLFWKPLTHKLRLYMPVRKRYRIAFVCSTLNTIRETGWH